MPRIPQKVLDTVVYLYATVEDAKAGINFGGTGFIVAVEAEADASLSFLYAVTNWHVACQGYPIIRVNTVDGGFDVFEFDDVQWQFDPRFDIAVIGIQLRNGFHKYTSIPVQAHITKTTAAKARIGPGDDVFMVGRFVDHDGGNVNRPALRFGHISIDPTPIQQSNGIWANSYCIDLHSRTGYSGSPVFAYRTPGFDLEQQLGNPGGDAQLLLAGVNFFMLLGIHFAQFPELWEVSEHGVLRNKETKEPLLTDGKFIRGLSGMTCVLPAWSILEVLNMPSLKNQRDSVNLAIKLLNSRNTPPVSEASGARDANHNHREDFMRLVGEAARKREQQR